MEHHHSPADDVVVQVSPAAVAAVDERSSTNDDGDEEAAAAHGGGLTRRTFSQSYKMVHRKPMEFTMWQVLLLSYQSLGIVYGDLGTSPLYVFSSITLPNPGKEDLLGILSLILWTLTLISLIKYTFIVLHADDHGEDLMNGIPPIVRHYVQHVGSIREVMVFVTVRILPVRSVLPEERFLIDKLEHVGVYRCIVQYGYMDNHNMEGDDFVVLVIASLKDITESDEEITLMDSAFTNGSSFVLGRTILKMSTGRNCFKRFVINNLYRFLQKNFRSNMSSLKIAPSKTLQVGMQYEI